MDTYQRLHVSPKKNILSPFGLVITIVLFSLVSLVFNSGSVAAVTCPTRKNAPITSPYGWRASTGSWHAGIDIGVDAEAIYASAGGNVTTGVYDGYGITKDLAIGNGRVYRYAHLSEGGANGNVNEGDRIGTSGITGNATGPVLHWEIRTDGGGFGIEGTIDPADTFQNCGSGGSSPAPSGSNPGNPPAPVTAPNPNDVGSSDCHSLVLRQGNFGGCVKHLQNHLNDYGYGLGVDGDFGPGTQNAVVDFQASRGLSPDGAVGPATWNALHNPPSNNPPVVNNPPANNPPVVNNPPAPTVIVPVSQSSGAGEIRGQGSGKCLDVSGASQSDTADVIIWGCNGGSNQHWRYEGGMIKVYGNKCLDVEGYSTQNNARVQIYECHGGSNQQWRFEGGLIKIYDNKCLDVLDYGTQDGAKVQIYDCHGASNQQWSF